jgi:hypothetical protein
MSKPNKREKKPNALINALPTPLVSFALVRISPSANSTSLFQHKPPNVFHAPSNSLYTAHPNFLLWITSKFSALFSSAAFVKLKDPVARL